MKKVFAFVISLIMISQISKADEGMWIPMLVKDYNFARMQELGFKLSADDIYSVNNSSLKDAVVIFGRGCTGEVVSNQGLIITNHHCGYGQIQSHSSVENDYLTNGFWAKTKAEELPNEGLTVTFLVRMERVTELVNKGVTDEMSLEEKDKKRKSNIKEIGENNIKDTHYKYVIKPFYGGNEYYMFINEVFEDVRLVGTPPSAIGKFGGDTDNWMWPRHTGDFSMFRIYADKNNKPAKYSKDNVPYKPKRHFKISLKGVKKGDFTMVLGYPGTTKEYLPSYAIKNIFEKTNPLKIAIRDKKLSIINQTMDKSPALRIKYASKAARVSNAWKKWIGQLKGLRKLDAINKKKNFEKGFNQWAKNNNKTDFIGLLPEFKTLYNDILEYELAEDYLYEAGYGVEIIRFARGFSKIKDGELPKKSYDRYKRSIDKFFKDIDIDTDKQLFRTLIGMYANECQDKYIPDAVKAYKGKNDKYWNKQIARIYKKSIFASKEKMYAFINKPSVKKLEKDPVYKIYKSINDFRTKNISPKYNELHYKIVELQKIYTRAQKEYNAGKLMYPDANFTMRVAFGQVDGYNPKDGVVYKHFTTLEGIIEKDNPEIYDYDVPDRLKELFKSKDYGQYASPVDGKIHICFVATNHTTGGNSGSPVLDAEGNLIGVNFDRCWEGTMSDLMYDPDQCRNISLDIRYLLFLVDKFAGAKHLVDEMELVK